LRWTKALKRYAEKSTVAGARIYGSGVPQRSSRSASRSTRRLPTCSAGNAKAECAEGGRSIEDSLEVLKLCVAQGVQACNLGELKRNQ
jgi:hypothetical protein